MGRELPILFNTDMVQAVMDDRKTATRRVIKPQPRAVLAYAFAGHKSGTWGYADGEAYKIWGDRYRLPDGIPDGELKRRWTPPCNTGDTLWVREAWPFQCCIECMDQLEDETCMLGKMSTIHEDKEAESEGCYIYRGEHPHPDRIVWRPSIHMPKDAARIWLKVTGVSVERLHDMTLDDFLSEGVVLRPEAFNDPDNAYLQAREIFKGIWDSTVRKNELARHGWEADPWVWAVRFERCGKPAAGEGE